MLRRLFNIGPTVITGVVGVITFATFLLPSAVGWRMPLVQIAVVIAGVAVLMGFIRLISVHFQRIRRRKGIFYSFVLILSALVTLSCRTTATTAVPRIPRAQRPLSSVCSGNLPRFLVDRPHGGEHHELVDQRASAGSSDPEHSAVIGMEESEMACAVADVGATSDLPVEDAPVMVPGPPGSAPRSPRHQPPPTTGS